jgi:hypothetical protein
VEVFDPAFTQGHLCQLQDGVHKSYTAQTISESQENIELLKLHMYEALHQRRISIDVIAGCPDIYICDLRPSKRRA